MWNNQYTSNFIIILILILINLSNQINTTSLVYPISLQLIDNSNAVIALDGIHFYDSAFENEEDEKFISLTIPVGEAISKYSEIFMAQFPKEYDEYIIIFVQKIIYIFDKNKNKLKDQNITDSVNAENYCIIPYKKNNNELNFFIVYEDNIQEIRKLNITNCIFNLSDLNSDLQIETISKPMKSHQGNNAQGVKGINCLIMPPLTTFEIDNDLLTCFGGVSWEPGIFSMTFNPENNFEEIESLRAYALHSTFNSIPTALAKTTKKKQKVLLYIICDAYPYWATFDYTNKFSTIYKEYINIPGSNDQLVIDYFNHKILYFTQTSEFMLISRLGDACKMFIIVFKNNFNIDYKGYVDITYEKDHCAHIQSFCIYYNNNKKNYTILADSGEWVSFFKDINEDFINLDIDNPNTSSDQLEEDESENNISTKILPTEINNFTTMVTTYIDILTTILTTEINNPTSMVTTYIDILTTILTTEIIIIILLYSQLLLIFRQLF